MKNDNFEINAIKSALIGLCRRLAENGELKAEKEVDKIIGRLEYIQNCGRFWKKQGENQ